MIHIGDRRMQGANRRRHRVLSLRRGARYAALHMIKNVARYVTLLFCLVSMVACAQGAGQSTSAPAKLDTEDQKTLYALGLLLGRNIKPFALTPDELAIVKAGLSDAVTDAKPQVELDTYGPKVNDLAQKRTAVGTEDNKKKVKEFADNVATEREA